jgi:hypothetical protein
MSISNIGGCIMKKKAWRIARESWIQSGGDVDGATVLAKRSIDNELSFGSLAVALLILQICVALFNLWKVMHLEEPEVEPDADGLRLMGDLNEA